MKTGANELCPCGSGTKYKRCCRNRKNDITTYKIRAVKVGDFARLREIGMADTSAKSFIEKAVTNLENYNDLENAYIAEFSGEIAGFVNGVINPIIGDKSTMMELQMTGFPKELANTSGEMEFSPQYLYVKPEFRGVNLGMKLMEVLEKRSGYKRFIIFHESSLQGYYSKQGYTYGINVNVGRKTL